MTNNSRFHSPADRPGRSSHPSRRDIDVATGILIGLRGYSERDAFDELVRASHRTGAGITSVARSLIAIARGSADTSTAHDAAVQLWGAALTGRPVYA